MKTFGLTYKMKSEDDKIKKSHKHNMFTGLICKLPLCLAEREAPELIESVKIIESQNSKYQLFIKLLISWSIIKTIWLYKKLGVNLGVILKRTQL